MRSLPTKMTRALLLVLLLSMGTIMAEPINEVSYAPMLIGKGISQYGVIKGLPHAGGVACQVVGSVLRCANYKGEEFSLELGDEHE